MKRTKQSKMLAVLMAVVMMFGMVPTAAFAAGDGPDGLCTHHSEHTPDCGYVQATEEAPCQHKHDEDCGYIEYQPEVPCNMGCAATEGGVMISPSAGLRLQPGCGGKPPAPIPMTKPAGTLRPVKGSPCNFVCQECSNEAKIDTVYYKFLADAVAAAEDGDTIELLKDVCVTKLSEEGGNHNDGLLKFSKAGTYTILGNGHTITSGYKSGTMNAEGPIVTAWNGAVVNLGGSQCAG